MDDASSASQAPVTRKGPWKIEDNDRWVDLLPSVPSRGYDGVRSRLKSPLVGMCAGKLATEHSNSITVFQMSQVGDVHHQVFSIEDKSDCEGCPRSAVLPSRVERQCMDFVEKVLKSRDSSTEARPLLLGKALKRKTTKAVMEAMKCSQEKGCHLCRHDNHMEEDAETVRLDACLPCLGCGLSAEEASTHLSAATHPNTVLTAAQLQGNVKSPKVPKLMASYKIRGLLGHRLWDHWEHGWSKVCGRYPFCLSSLAAIGVQKMELLESPSKSAKKTPSIKRRTAVTPSNTLSRKKVNPPQQPEDEGLESTALPTKGVSQVGMPTLVLKKVPLPPDGLGQVWSGCSPGMLPGQGTPDSQSRNGVRSQSAIRSMPSVSTKTPRNFHSLKRRSNQIGF
ncbi:uncharacterized protein [Diadema antillarum]|uniref:uncharacterized protein n=1 Tax=Diadema antillarum TaxID=105358 RepID=UPI003A853A9E